MKKNFYLVLVVLSFSVILISCGSNNSASLIGTWQLESVSGEELTETEKSATIEFKSDGKAIQTKGERVREGKWEMKEEGSKKNLIITFNEKAENYEVVELTASTLVFLEDDDKISFKKK